MARTKHPDGRAGIWIEVKLIKGLRYIYERTRVYAGGKAHIESKYLGKAPSLPGEKHRPAPYCEDCEAWHPPFEHTKPKLRPAERSHVAEAERKNVHPAAVKGPKRKPRHPAPKS